MKKIVLSIACCLLAPSLANAGLSLSQTRIVFTAPEKQTTIKVSNSSKDDALFQSWLDYENDALADIPFAVVPTFSKVSGEGTQILRIIAQGASLPEDRESVFWLNVQEIPRVSTEFAEGNASGVSFSIRQRIKLFYRPTSVTTDPIAMTEKLAVRVAPDNKQALLFENNSGNYITLIGFRKMAGGKEQPLSDVIMLPPLSTSTLSLSEDVKSGDDIRFESMSDSGFPRPFKLVLAPMGDSAPQAIAEQENVQ